MNSIAKNIDCVRGMKEYPDKYFDLCCTDPPYGVDLEYNTYDDTLENWYQLINDFLPEARRVSQMVIMPSCSINKLHWIYANHPPDWLMSWNKGSTGHNSYIGFNSWEPLLVYGKIKGMCMHDVISVSNTEKMGNYGHPCPKPITWFSTIYSKALKGKGKVLDCFMGSGTSRISAYNEGLDYVGFELDKDYFEAQEKRFNNHISQTNLFKVAL